MSTKLDYNLKLGRRQTIRQLANNVFKHSLALFLAGETGKFASLAHLSPQQKVY